VTSRQRALGPGDRESLIESHLPLAKSVARRYVGRGVELDDLVQVAAVGLVKAANRFDVRRGASFHAFAEPTIEGEIRHHLRDRSGTVRIPRELQRLGERLRGQQSQLAARLGRAPTLSELADAVDADTKQVERALAAERAREPVTLVQAEEGTEDPSATEPYADSENRLLLTERMHVLAERERQIVYLRFHADMTERQIAHEVGISQAHVSRLLAGALTKLRGELGKDETPEKPGDTTVQGVVSPPPTAADGPGARPVKAAAGAKPSGKLAAGYSGRFLVRMSGDLHRQLAQAAERRQVSLNRFVTESLAESLTDERPDAPRASAAPVADPPYPDEDRASGSHDPRRTLRMVLAANLVLVVVAGTIAVVLLVLALQQGL
jgi:RNA polymerase sigma-B factor